MKTPLEVQKILLNCWHKDPASRPDFATVHRVFADLAKIQVKDEPTAVKSAGPAAPPPSILLSKIAHRTPVRCLCIVSPNSLWTGEADGVINVFDTASFSRRNNIQAHAGAIYQIVAVNGGVWSSADNGVIRHWDSRTQDCLAEVVAHTGAVLSLLVIPAVELCVWSADTDGLVLQWTNTVDGLQPQRVTQFPGVVNQLVYDEAQVDVCECVSV